MSNIVISTHWTDGDVIPFIRIGKALKERGHRVTLLTHCCYEQEALKAGLEFTAWDTPEQYSSLVRDMGNHSGSATELDKIQDFRDKYESLDVRLNEFEKISRHCRQKDTVILAKNRSSIAALMASEKFQCPIVLFFMNPSEMGSILAFHELFKDRLREEANEMRKHVGLPPVNSWLEWQLSPKIQLALWPEWFSPEAEEWPVKVKTVGFPVQSQKSKTAYNIPKDIEEILREDPAPILITGGTSRQIRPDFYPKAIEACGILGKKTILVTRYKELLPETLPSNVIWFRHVPLDDILPYMGAVIHHGGIGTVSGAVYAALPQLALAYYVDRPLNARRIKKLGLGEYLPPSQWEPVLIAGVLEKLLEEPYKKKCVDFLRKIPDDNAIDTVCGIAETISGNSEYAVSCNATNR